MSCTKCESSTERVTTFVRVDRANVEIGGCREHLAELIRVLRLGVEADKEDGFQKRFDSQPL